MFNSNTNNGFSGNTGFGQTTNTGGFGQPQQGGFGSNTGTNSAFAFGASTQPSTGFGSTFGQPATNTTSAFGTGGGFGTTTTQTTPNTGFGYGSTAPTTNSAFGATTQQPSAFGINTTSAFGSSNPTTFGTSSFGASTTTPSTGFGFGQNKPTTPGFGSTNSGISNQNNNLIGFGTINSGFGSATSAFSSQPLTSSAFGSSSTGNGTLSTPYIIHRDKDMSTGGALYMHSICAIPNYRNYSNEELRYQDYLANRKFIEGPASSAFGSTSAFGSQPTTSNFGSNTGGFGSQSSAFGAQPSTTSAFGAQPSTSSTFGITTTPSTGFGFNQSKPATNGFGTISGFGASNTGFGTTSGFGSTPVPTNTFGSNTGTSAFGSNTATSGFGTSTTNNAFGTGTTQNKPIFGATAQPSFGFGATTTPAAPTTTSSSGFGVFGNNNNNNTASNSIGFGNMNNPPKPTYGLSTPSDNTGSLFNTNNSNIFRGFGATNTNNAFGSTNNHISSGFNTGTSTQNANLNAYYNQVEKYPYGMNPIIDNYRLPKKINEPSESHIGTHLSGDKFNKELAAWAKKKEQQEKEKVTVSLLSDVKYKPKFIQNAYNQPSQFKLINNNNNGSQTVVTKPTIEPSTSYLFTKDNTFPSSMISSLITPKVASFRNNSSLLASNTGFMTSSSNTFVDPIKASEELGKYWMLPTAEDLNKLTLEELKSIPSFKVGRTGYGEVQFQGPLDLSNIKSFEAIPNFIVRIMKSTVIIYPNNETKPAPGSEMNVLCTVYLANCWPKTGRQDRNFQAHIEALKKIPNTKFLDYLKSTGTWKFEILPLL